MKISESFCSLIFLFPLHRTAAFSFRTNVVKQPATWRRNPRPRPRPRQAVAVNMNDEPSVAAIPVGMPNDDAPAMTAFELLAGRASMCLLESDIRRDAIGKPEGTQASSATNWINDATAFALQRAVDSVELKLPDRRVGVDRDEASTWIRWMKSTPTTLIVDLSGDLRKQVNETLNQRTLELIGTTRDDFLARMGCRLILLPSGSTLERPLEEPPASVVYGKLLYGGVTRYRLLPSSANRPKRRAGERTEVKTSIQDTTPVWLMYGGPERAYDCVDMGAAAVLELILLPQGKTLPNIMEQPRGDMTVSRIVWSPHKMFECVDKSNVVVDGDSTDEMNLLGSLPAALSGKARNEAFQSDFRSAVGGLQPQIEAIVRRVLDGRVIRPAEVVDLEMTSDETTRALALAAMEAEELSLLGLSPVRGLLLYGPPGCGKTALARELSRALKARQPKIVSAPELLDRWVGGSEKLVRALFSDAEAELAACNGDASRSALHVIVIDEIDAVFRKRSSGEDSGESTRASAVNQILSKLDGINAIPNVLMIGMTNRRELLDEALLRPGRLEVQIEIPLPDKEGRREIMQIHFDALRKKGRLSKPLCCAIDGVSVYSVGNVAVNKGESSSERRGVRQRLGSLFAKNSKFINPAYDLAAVTTGYSGADIAGLVRCAGSMALARARKDGSGVEGLLITLEDVKQSLKEVKR
jgi:vesicle-fusing ATPase